MRSVERHRIDRSQESFKLLRDQSPPSLAPFLRGQNLLRYLRNLSTSLPQPPLAAVDAERDEIIRCHVFEAC